MVVVVDTASRGIDVFDIDDNGSVVAARSNGDGPERMSVAVVDDDDVFIFISPLCEFEFDRVERASNKPFRMNPKSSSCLDKALSISLEM